MIKQQTPEWLEARRGKLTASNMLLVYGRSQAYRDLIRAQLKGAEITEAIAPPLLHGKKYESHARALYELYTDTDVTDAEFVLDSKYPFLGCSPDGYVGAGLAEFKCPITKAEHLHHIIETPFKYYLQIQTQLAVTKRPWCDYVSFFEDIEITNQLIIRRIEWDTNCIKEIYRRSVDFWEWVNGPDVPAELPSLF